MFTLGDGPPIPNATNHSLTHSLTLSQYIPTYLTFHYHLSDLSLPPIWPSICRPSCPQVLIQHEDTYTTHRDLGTELFTKANLFAAKSLACYWHQYEALEHFLHSSVTTQVGEVCTFSCMSIVPTHSTLTLRLPLQHPRSDHSRTFV